MTLMSWRRSLIAVDEFPELPSEREGRPRSSVHPGSTDRDRESMNSKVRFLLHNRRKLALPDDPEWREVGTREQVIYSRGAFFL